MSGFPSGVQAESTARHGRPQLTLDVERVLGVSVRQAIRAEFTFDPNTPLAVCARFEIQGGPCVLWRIGRDLLRRGLHTRSGSGDVQLWPSPSENRPTAWLRLASGDMAALFELPAQPLAEWLEHTYDLVPAGRELSEVDWDVTAAALLDRR
ncbi:SsgA family sporulation/cell division regulator [Streptomyces sp. p1417]|uniref:SsgA family sporulation/cell division regulator n=1 Tax=Streptomyces typhae TaxID=2681492 RepID=A0A6L6WX77_9ACTN|nr:SsgA family sporulation/cell division regulator [Streptomyces typhae]MVO85391.1 SsgA family sporulation/cell division regulator [Streptomyces typhae]